MSAWGGLVRLGIRSLLGLFWFVLAAVLGEPVLVLGIEDGSLGLSSLVTLLTGVG